MRKLIAIFLFLSFTAGAQVTVLPARSGGTGLSTYTIGQMIYASGATALSRLNIGTTGQVLSVSGGLPYWSSIGLLVDSTKWVPIAGTYSAHPLSGNIQVNNGLGTWSLYSKDATDSIEFSLTPSSDAVIKYTQVSSGKYYGLYVNNGGIGTTTTFTNFPGIVYGADYSSHYTNRSLIDKGYASSTFAPISYSTAVTYATSPLSISTNTVSISQSNGSTNGYLSSTDWTTFNNKQSALSVTAPITLSTNTLALTSTGSNSVVLSTGATISSPTVSSGSFSSGTYTSGTFTASTNVFIPSYNVQLATEASSTTANATTYYWGMLPGTGMSTTQNIRGQSFPGTGTIRSISYNERIVTPATSAQTATLSIVIYDGTGSVQSTNQLSTAMTFTANNVSGVFTGLNISVTAGWHGEMKLTTPTYTTGSAPSGFSMSCQAYVGN